MVDPQTLAEGTELPPLHKTVDLATLRLYSGPGRSLHSDEAAARAAGYPAPIAWGLQSAAFCSELLLRTFGAAWVSGGQLRVRFRRPVPAGERLTIRARVTARTSEAASHTLSFEVWCEDEAGQRVTQGQASVRLPESRPLADGAVAADA
jgi:acyl dehydratase